MTKMHGSEAGTAARARRGAARKSERTREEILAAAARLFRRKGVDGATLRDLAGEARLEAGSLYYHFSSKEEIVEAVLDRGVRGIVEDVRAALEATEAAPFRDRFAAAVAAHLRQLHAMGDFTSMNIRNFSQLPPQTRMRHRPVRREYAALWDGMLAEGQTKGAIRADVPPAPLRQFVLGALNWTVEWFDPSAASLEALGGWISGMMLDGISAPEWRGAAAGGPEAGDGPEEDAEGAAKAERTREAILRSAARLIRDRGYTATTLRAIAAEAEVEAGSIYYHFRSKEEILDEVLDRGLREMRDGLAAATAEPCAGPAEHRARIAAAIRAHLRRLMAHGEFTSANIRNYGRLPADVRRRHRPVRAEYSALWERLLADARKAGAIRADVDPSSARQVILGALNWTVEWFDAAPGPGRMSAQDYAEMCVALILDGVAARG
ncbi:MAG: TetR family transcriptional regulator [Pseudomonadota bacterium]